MKRAYGIASGKLRERVEIQTRTGTQTEAGDETESWAVTTTVWAMVRPLFGNEAMLAKQVTPTVTHTVVMRYTGSVTPESRLRVVDTGKYLQVVDVRDIDLRTRRTECTCREVVR